jgi:hypothetical protein
MPAEANRGPLNPTSLWATKKLGPALDHMGVKPIFIGLALNNNNLKIERVQLLRKFLLFMIVESYTYELLYLYVY